MKQILLLLVILIGYTPIYAQNLVPNPSFEEFDACPPNTSINTFGIPRIKDYIKFWEDNDVSSFGSSSDFFHTCANIYNSNIGPATGNGHLGVFTYTNNDYREYVQAPLKTALCRGRTYRVKLKLASSRGARRNTDRIGVYFSNGRFTPPNAEAVPLTTQVETPAGQFIDNETRWREFTMIFMNTGGGEDHLTIGNFRRNSNTNFTGSGSNTSNAYIYIDDVLVEDITPTLTISGGNINDATCGSANGGVTGISVSGGSGTYSYRWIDEDGNLISTDLNPSNFSAGTYELLIADGGACEELANRRFIIDDDCPEPCPRTNLAPNPGFEEIRRCPNQRSLNRNDLGRNVREWYSPNDGTPTLFHQCALGAPFMSGTPSPYPGQGFVGFYTYYYAAEYGDDRKEYVQARLASPMVAGQSYIVKFDIRLRVARNYATDQMGVYFSNNAVTINGSNGELGVTPSLKTPAGTYFTNTDNWQTVTFGSPYIANGGEEYITIGKFEDVANTTFQDLIPGQGSAEAFYFIDNVVVEPASGANGSINAGADQIIDNTQTAQLQATPTGGTPISYTWTPTTGLSDPTIENPVFTPPTGAGTYTFTVEADFGGGCSSTDQVTITVIASCSQTIHAGPDQTINSVDTATLTATTSTGTPNYTWTSSPVDTSLSGQENTQNPTVSPLQTTTYTVTADFGGGCNDSDTITVTVIDPSCQLILDDSTIRLNDADCGQTNGSITGITITGNSGNENYSWIDTNGNQIANTIDLIGVGPEDYLLIVEQGACTTTSGPYSLRESGAPIVDDTNVSITNANCDQSNGSITGIIITNPSGNETYSWTDASGTEVGTDINLAGRGPDSYLLNVEVEACSVTIGPFSINEIDNCEDPTSPNIRIASILTPNGDNSNDMFMISGLENYSDNRLYIFNRWGNKVYEASKYQNDWYGTYQNKPLPVATYYYILELNDSNRQVYKGAITIIR